MEVLLERRSHGIGKSSKGTKRNRERNEESKGARERSLREREREMVTLVAGDVNMHMDQ